MLFRATVKRGSPLVFVHRKTNDVVEFNPSAMHVPGVYKVIAAARGNQFVLDVNDDWSPTRVTRSKEVVEQPVYKITLKDKTGYAVFLKSASGTLLQFQGKTIPGVCTVTDSHYIRRSESGQSAVVYSIALDKDWAIIVADWPYLDGVDVTTKYFTWSDVPENRKDVLRRAFPEHARKLDRKPTDEQLRAWVEMMKKKYR